ncbi:MAG: zf-HC2 domain-containing protein [Anaerolineales bacterium]
MHLTDDLLNEYLDNEAAERAQIESHLASCADCAARLTALQALFAELDSLPEVELTHSLASRITLHAASPLELPRWLTLTAISQAAFALLLLLVAAPFVMNLLPAIEAPSFAEVLIQLQTQWLTLFNSFTNYQLPSLPSLPPLQIPTLTLSLALAGASLLWLVGNGLLLRKQIR